MRHQPLFSFIAVMRCTRILFGLAIILFAQPGIAGDANHEKKLRQLRQSIEELRKELAATKNNRDEVSRALEDSEKSIGTLSKKAQQIEGELKHRKKKLDDLQSERGQLNRQKLDQEAMVADYLNAAYRLGQQGNLRLLLNQEDPARVARNLKYYDYFIAARTEKITQYMIVIERISAIEPQIARQAEMIRANLNFLNVQKQKLEQAQIQRKIVLAKLNRKVSGQDQRLQELVEDRRQLEKLLSKVIQNISDVAFEKNAATFASLKGRLPWPTRGKVLRRFGSSRVANRMRWQGILIASREGSPVHAVHYGQVVFSDYLRGQGLLIILDHGAGFMSLYAHNQALFKELGEWVESGDVIASVGNSGGQKNSALYFELRYRGKPTNPQSWFERV